MKRWLLTGLIFYCCAGAHGQATFSNTGSGIGDLRRFVESKDSVSDDLDIANAGAIPADIEEVEIDVTDSSITFSNLPDKLVMLQLRDDEGETIINRNISAFKNRIPIWKLPEGVFYITLLYKEKRKQFTFERYPEY